MSEEKKIGEDLKELVIFRVETLPLNKKISIGSYGEFNRDELVMHVKKEDEIGKKIVKIELEFLKALKKGKIV